jgi:hypothetical protein
MSDMTAEGEFEAVGLEPSLDEPGSSRPAELDEVLNDLFAAIEELGLASGASEEAGSGVAGCYLSVVPSDRHGHGGVVVSWLLPDSAGDTTALPPVRTEALDILNEALGPLLLGLGFPVEPYAADGHWIVTGPRIPKS